MGGWGERERKEKGCGCGAVAEGKRLRLSRPWKEAMAHEAAARVTSRSYTSGYGRRPCLQFRIPAACVQHDARFRLTVDDVVRRRLEPGQLGAFNVDEHLLRATRVGKRKGKARDTR